MGWRAVLYYLIGAILGFGIGYAECKHRFSKPSITTSTPIAGTGSPLPVFIENISTENKVTVIAPVAATINGASTLVIPPNQQCIVTSKDGNYEAFCKSNK